MQSNKAFREQIFAIVRETFPHFRGEMTEETVATQVSGWDSFAHMQLMLTIEDKMRIDFDPAATFDLKNIGDLIRFLEERHA